MVKVCIDCGDPFEPNSNAQKRCLKCREITKKEQSVKTTQKYRQKWGYRNKKILGTRDFSEHRLLSHDDEKKAVREELLKVNPNVSHLPMKRVSKNSTTCELIP